MNRPKVFFGYPSKPEQLRHAVNASGGLITQTNQVEVMLWEDLKVSGNFVIDIILKSIKTSELSVFDITTPNQNVMFELGYAIGADRPIWLLRDTTWESAALDFKALHLLTTVGYVEYQSSEDIRTAFLKDSPHISQSAVFTESIQPTLSIEKQASVFYVMSPHSDDTSRAITRRVDRENMNPLPVLIYDPNESTVESLPWIAQCIHQSEVTVVAFTSPERKGGRIHNARAALVSGLAMGMGKDVLMLANADYLAPIDYRDIAQVYNNPRQAKEIVNSWLEGRLATIEKLGIDSSERKAQIALATELGNLSLGDHIAENEVAALDVYFVETSAYRQAVSSTSRIFVGRKGSGKTASFFQAAAELERDRRILSVVIKPRSYELSGMLTLLDRYGGQDVRDFLTETIWMFLLYTAMATAAIKDIESRPAGPPSTGTPEWELLNYASQYPQLFEEDFALRFEYAVEQMLNLDLVGSIAEDRTKIVHALHAELLAYLRQLLGRVLGHRDRVALLVDNLDKAWESSADTNLLAQFLLGLFGATNRMSQDFARDDSWRDPVHVTYAVYLREDVFRYVRAVAREPDKLPVRWMKWTDPELLRRVAEQRYEAAREDSVAPGELWDRFFPESIRGLSPAEYLTTRILPRPRDLVFLCNAAIAKAVGRGHSRVDEEDVFAAEEDYSLFAFEAIQVENGSADIALEDVLYAFAGCPSILSENDVDECLNYANVPADQHDVVTKRLIELSFLGLETQDDNFEYAEQVTDPRKVEILAERLAESRGEEARYQVHPAFHAFLEVIEVPSSVV